MQGLLWAWRQIPLSLDVLNIWCANGLLVFISIFERLDLLLLQNGKTLDFFKMNSYLVSSYSDQHEMPWELSIRSAIWEVLFLKCPGRLKIYSMCSKIVISLQIQNTKYFRQNKGSALQQVLISQEVLTSKIYPYFSISLICSYFMQFSAWKNSLSFRR